MANPSNAVLPKTLPSYRQRRSSPIRVSPLVVESAALDAAGVYSRLSTRPEGLTAEEAAALLAEHGPNVLAKNQRVGIGKLLWHAVLNPLVLLLAALATISFATGDSRAGIVMCLMIALGVSLKLIQEAKADSAAAKLKAMISVTATAFRDGTPQEIAVSGLVPGDVVKLAAGDMIPGDVRIVAAKDLFIIQGSLTGESFPVEKFETERNAATTAPLELTSIAFLGTSVESGSATAVVVTTGRETYLGGMAQSLSQQQTLTAFDRGIARFTWLMLRFILVMVPLVFVINGLTKRVWSEAFFFAVAVAVGLTPEMLPMIVTSTLAKGAVLLSRKKVVVKRLDAIQNFGAMDVLCTDKTGTLTQDKIAVARKDDVFGRPSEEVLNFAFLNSFYQTGLKNLLDHAVLEHVELASELKLQQDYRKVDEIPFDFERRRMSVVVAVMVAGRDDHHELICKGAVEEVLAACTSVRAEDGAASAEAPLDAAMLERVKRITGELNDEGLRVVAVAVKTIPPAQTAYSIADEAGLTLIGYIAFLDPPKESAAPALRALAAHGIRVVVLTGDNEPVTACVCKQVGLAVDKVLLGAEVEAMTDAALALAVEEHRVFAKLTPLHKERIVRALRSRGHVVGFMGDGINDAPALRAADIGISVDSAVDIAKEAADIILLEKSLMVLDEGVVEGRTTFCNMLKYIRMTASSNFGNVFSVLVASAFLPFLPMLPLQLLTQNLLYDISQTGIPFDNVDAELVTRPLQWNPADIGRFMLFFGPISSLFDIATFALMWFVFDATTPAKQGLFQSGWFVVGLLTQTLVVHMIRTPKLPFIQSRASASLTGMTIAIMAFGVFLPMGPLAGYFKLQPLPLNYFGWLAAILLGYGLLTTLMKRVYIRRFGWQ